MLIDAAPTRPRRLTEVERGFVPMPHEVDGCDDSLPEVDSAAATGWVLVDVGSLRYAVPLDEVYGIARAQARGVLPALASARGDVSLLDVRGRSVPVVDARSARAESGEVVLPVYRTHAGLIVDRVHAVSDDLVPETDAVEGIAQMLHEGVLRSRDGSGGPILVRPLPRIEELGISAGLAFA